MKKLPDWAWAQKFKLSEQLQANGCVNWMGSIDRLTGYGYFYAGNYRTTTAHRFAYELVNGPVPKGLVIDHICRNRRCVNPEHLRAVSNGENVLCGEGIAAVNARKKNCNRGHPLDGDNLFINANGGRCCRICSNETLRRYREKRRALRSVLGARS